MTHNNNTDLSRCAGQDYLDDAEAMASVIVLAPPSRHGALQTGPKTDARPTQRINVHDCMGMVCVHMYGLYA